MRSESEDAAAPQADPSGKVLYPQPQTIYFVPHPTRLWVKVLVLRVDKAKGRRSKPASGADSAGEIHSPPC